MKRERSGEAEKEREVCVIIKHKIKASEKKKRERKEILKSKVALKRKKQLPYSLVTNRIHPHLVNEKQKMLKWGSPKIEFLDSD